MSKKESISKKLKSMNIGGVFDGFTNKVTGRMEEAARQRSAICMGCPEMVDEPIAELAIVDNKIPDISGKMCNVCGCALPYLLRQNKKKCKLKKW